MTLILPRRTFLTGLISLIAAPALVRAAAIMPIRPWRPTFHRAVSTHQAQALIATFSSAKNPTSSASPLRPRLAPAAVSSG